MLTKTKSTIFIVILAAAVLFAPTAAQADAWSANVMAARMKQVWEEIEKTIHGIIMGVLKQAAVEMINSTVNSMIAGGGAGGPLFITDWDDELFYQPARQAELYMNDFFTLTLRGTAHGSDYITTSYEGAGKNYTAYLRQQAEAATTKRGASTYNLSDYVSDPSEMFATGNLKPFLAHSLNCANNPACFSLMAQEFHQQALEQEQKKAEAKAIAYQGFEGQEKDGQTVTPGSTIKDIQSASETMSFDIVANAQNIPEVITALVTKIVTKTIRQGIGNVRSNIQREYTPLQNYGSALDQVIDTQGPGATFKPSY